MVAIRTNPNFSERETLTEKELSIIRLVRDGYTNADIAVSIQCSINVVRQHIWSACNVTGTENRVSLVMHCIRRGWIGIE
jgi:DNA-binding CsgD family transcriptional regulator